MEKPAKVEVGQRWKVARRMYFTSSDEIMIIAVKGPCVFYTSGTFPNGTNAAVAQVLDECDLIAAPSPIEREPPVDCYLTAHFADPARMGYVPCKDTRGCKAVEHYARAYGEPAPESWQGSNDGVNWVHLPPGTSRQGAENFYRQVRKTPEAQAAAAQAQQAQLGPSAAQFAQLARAQAQQGAWTVSAWMSPWDQCPCGSGDHQRGGHAKATETLRKSAEEAANCGHPGPWGYGGKCWECHRDEDFINRFGTDQCCPVSLDLTLPQPVPETHVMLTGGIWGRRPTPPKARYEYPPADDESDIPDA